MKLQRNPPLAIVGMACRLPGAPNLTAYWRLLLEGRHAIVKIPDELLERELYFDERKGQLGKTYIDHAGLVDYPAFDPTRCNYPTRLMGYVDVGHLVMCQVAADACRQGGLDPFDLRRRNSGVYIGNNQSGRLAPDLAYSTLVEEAAQYLYDLALFREMTGDQADAVITEVVADIRRRLPRYGRGGCPSVGFHVTANAVSEALGLNGPSIVLDAACSSSLKALAMAARDLWLGNTDMAIVGGSSFYHSDGLIIFSAAQAGSTTGSIPFSDRADGLVSAEGYAAVVVKTLDRAVADGDRIQCVVAGIGVSSDGRGKSLWAPRKAGQIKAIERAYLDGADLERVSYLEAHATSTSLGDQTELEAIDAVFRGKLASDRKIPLGGVKANIGHVLEAAGLAGLLKAALVLQNEVIPQQINSQPLNSKVDWESVPFYIPHENEVLAKRADGLPRQAAINAFGIGGLNAHVVLEEYTAPAARTQHAVPAKSTRVEGRVGNAAEPIAVVGVGCVFPGARTLEAFADLVFSGRDPKCDVPADRWNASTGHKAGAIGPWTTPVTRGGFVTDFAYDWRRHRIAPKQIATANPLQFMILDGLDAALADAGYDQKPFDTENTGVTVGTTFNTEFSMQLCMGFRLPHFRRELARVLQRRGLGDESRRQELMDAFVSKVLKHMPALLDDTGSFTPSSLASRLTKTYNLMGGGGTIDTGNSVGLAAIAQAVNALRTATCEVMICAVGARSMGLATFARMGLAGHLATGDAKTTLDEGSDGHLPGEGAAVLILKRLSDAQRDGDPIGCIIHGIGTGFADDPQSAFTQAIERSWTSSRVSPGNVQLIEVSSAPPAITARELAAIGATYGRYERSQPLWLSCADSQIGNTLAASGMASLLKANFELERLTMPAQFGLQKPRAEFAQYRETLAAPLQAVRLRGSSDEDKILASVSSWDECGSAYHLILQRGTRVPLKTAKHDVDWVPEAAPLVSSSSPSGTTVAQPLNQTTGDDNPAWRIVRIGAASPSLWATEISAAAMQAEERYRQAGPRNGFRHGDQHRMAIVASDPQDLAEKLSFAAKHYQAGSAEMLARKCIHVAQRVGDSRGLVAFMFSGQGSQYNGMLRSLAEGYPPAVEIVRVLDRDLVALGYPTWADLAWEHGDKLGADVFRTQLSLLVADTILLRALAVLGVRPDRVAGHSFGEFPALAAAGVWTFAEAANATKIRCNAIVGCRQAEGGMLFTSADETTARRLCEQTDGEVYVANINAPHQTVLGGRSAALENALAVFRGAGFVAKILPVNRPFHTMIMKDVQDPLQCELATIPTAAPTLPMRSSVTNEYVVNGEEVRRNLVAQMTQPVRYMDLVSRFVDDGVTTFVECGPRSVLTDLHAKIVTADAVSSIAADQPKRDGLCQLLSVRAHLEVRGHLDDGEPPTSVSIGGESATMERVQPPTPSPQPSPPKHLPLRALKTRNNAEGKCLGGEGADTKQALGSPVRTGLDSDQVDWGRRHASSIRALLRQQADTGSAMASRSDLSAQNLDDVRAMARGAGVWWSALAAMAGRLSSEGGDDGFSVGDRLRELIESCAHPLEAEYTHRTPTKPVTETARASTGTDQTASADFSASSWTADPSRFHTIKSEDFRKLNRSVKGAPPIDFGVRKYCRFKMRVMEKPVVEVDWSRLKFNGRVLIVGDNDVARELAIEITGHGGKPVVLQYTEDIDAALRDLERHWDEDPLLHLYLLTPHDDDAVTDTSEPIWNLRRQRGIMFPYLVTRRWFQLVSKAKLTAQASLHAATLLGGDLGFSGQNRNVESGAIAGLVKSMLIEAGVPTGFAFKAKVIDFSGVESPTARAQSILTEVALNAPYETEIGYAGGHRYLVRPIPQLVEPTASTVRSPRGTWVVTGGGRGITAFLAQHVAARFGLRLHLLGSSPAPAVPPPWRNLDERGRQQLRNGIFARAKREGQSPVKAWRHVERMLELDETLREMSAAGVEATYHSCDVSNRSELAATLEAVRRASGPIHGILHGAGIEVSARMEMKDPAIVSKTLAVKTDAAAALIELTRSDPLGHFIGLGSTAARLGSPGQTDYAMANEAMAKLLDWYQVQRPDCHVTCFHWGPWDQIGMAARPEMRNALLDVTMLPPPEGLAYFFDELVATERSVETLLFAWNGYKLFYPDQIPMMPGATLDAKPSEPDPSSVTTDAAGEVDFTGATPPEPAHDGPAEEIQRMVLRWVERPGKPATKSEAIPGAALILGRNRDADALVERLQKQGVSVAQVQALENDDEATSTLDRIWRGRPVSHLFMLTGRDPTAAQIEQRDNWFVRRRQGLFGPFYLLRHWLRKVTEAGTFGSSAVVAVTALGGDCGFASGADAIEGAGIAGLLKTVHAEHGGPKRDGLQVKIIDAPSEADSSHLATAVLAELSMEGLDIEVAYVDSKRRVPRLVRERADVRRREKLRPHTNWVVTGGARGISAAVVKSLGMRYGLKLHLLGTRPLPRIDDSLRRLSDDELKSYKREVVRQAIQKGKTPAEVWDPVRRDLEIDRNLRAMRAAGIDVTYHPCDVIDSAQLETTLDEIRRLSGPIHGIIHGAGIDANPCILRDMAASHVRAADRLIAIKCDATLELLRLTKNDPLHYFVGFGSISGRFGANSASFYCAGNDMLCKLVGRLRRQRPGCRAVGFHWHGWGEVGMMMRPSGHGPSNVLKMQLLSPRDGIEHLVRELESGAPESEIVVSDSKYYTLYHSEELLIEAKDALPLRSPSATCQASASQETDVDNVSPLIHGLCAHVADEEPIVAECEFQPATDRFLIDHRFQGRPMLPAVIALESFAETAQRFDPAKRVVAIRDLQLYDGMRFPTDASRLAEVHADLAGTLVACRLVADFRNRRGQLVDPGRLHASAVVELADHLTAPAIVYVPPVEEQWHDVSYSDPSALMYHGPTFQLLTKCAFASSGEVWGKLNAAGIDQLAGHRPATGWLTHPAVVDASLYLCGIAVWVQEDGALGLPKGLDCLRLGRLPKPAEPCLVYLRQVGADDREKVFDIVCYGADHGVIFAVDGYHCQLVLKSLKKTKIKPASGLSR